MKHIKRFNEELNPETYISAADKLKYNHPERANKLREYGKSKQDPSIFDKEWDFIVIGDYVGTVTAKLKQYRTTTGYYFETVREDLKSTDFTSGHKPNITNININNNGLAWGGDNIYGSCYVSNRKEALELKRVLSEIGYDISVNDLYTERKPKQGYDYEEPKKPWIKRLGRFGTKN